MEVCGEFQKRLLCFVLTFLCFVFSRMEIMNDVLTEALLSFLVECDVIEQIISFNYYRCCVGRDNFEFPIHSLVSAAGYWLLATDWAPTMLCSVASATAQLKMV